MDKGVGAGDLTCRAQWLGLHVLDTFSLGSKFPASFVDVILRLRLEHRLFIPQSINRFYHPPSCHPSTSLPSHALSLLSGSLTSERHHRLLSSRTAAAANCQNPPNHRVTRSKATTATPTPHYTQFLIFCLTRRFSLQQASATRSARLKTNP